MSPKAIEAARTCFAATSTSKEVIMDSWRTRVTQPKGHRMTTNNELRDELVEAIERIHDAIDPYEPFDASYEAAYVCSYILGISIVDFNDDNVADDPDDIARLAAINAAFPTEIEAVKKATTEFIENDCDERASHKYALALLDILDTLK